MLTPYSVSDTTKPLTLSQVDSLIRLSEGLKTLRERFDVSIREAATFRSLWQSEKDNRAKDKADYTNIINGYAAIETSHRLEIAGLNKKYRGQVRKNRILFILFVAAGSFGVYQTIK